MSILNIFKKKKTPKKKDAKEKKTEKKELKLKEKAQEPKAPVEKQEETTLRPKGDLDLKPSKDVKVKRSKKEDTKNAYKVLLKPLITEKATDLVSQNKYCFEVASGTNKIEIKKAIKALYNVEPVSVNIIKMRGKRVTHGRISGKRKNWKKAIITLKPGDKIEVYEGV